MLTQPPYSRAETLVLEDKMHAFEAIAARMCTNRLEIVAQEALDFFGRCVEEVRQQRLIACVRHADGTSFIASLDADTDEVVTVLLTEQMLREAAEKYVVDAINRDAVFFGS